jgi:hypothetical protein
METTYENAKEPIGCQTDNGQGASPLATSAAAASDTSSHTPSADAPKPGNVTRANGKPGAPRGNAHALRTGLRSPKCPPAARGIDGMRYAFRRQAFADYRARHGLAASAPVPFFVECRIDAAVRHHKNALLIEWLIRREEPPAGDAAEAVKAAYADRVQAMLEKSADFSDRRDKALREAGLDVIGSPSATDPFAAFDAARRQNSHA